MQILSNPQRTFFQICAYSAWTCVVELLGKRLQIFLEVLNLVQRNLYRKKSNFNILPIQL